MLIEIEPLIRKRLPIIDWLPRYTKADGVSDLIAGLTVGLTLMPQAIAYAALAGLEPQFGLYSGCAGILMYVIFGSTRQITIGPTALLSLLTYNYTHEFFGGSRSADLAVLFTFLVGVIELLSGFLQLGSLVNFVSTPVISGFTSAAALIIASAQMKNLFGLKYNAETFIDIWREFFKHSSEMKLYDVILGFSCIAVLASLKKMNTINYNTKELSRLRVTAHHALWAVTTARNALVVVACASLSYYFKSHLDVTPFTLTGNIVSGAPGIKLPPVSVTINGTEVGFAEMASHLGSGLLVVPLIAVISNLALAKAFSNGGQVDATQEMIALGMCNIVGSFVQSMPVAGAFSRSAVNNSSGVRTTFGCVYTSILVLLTLNFLTPYFYYIPRASLAAVIVTAVLLMIDVDIIIKPIWSVHKFDLFPGFVTFIFSLIIGIEIGLIIGISIDIILILHQTARPTITVEKIINHTSVQDMAYWSVLIKYDVIMFPAVDHIRSVVFDKIIVDNKISKFKGKDDQQYHSTVVVIDCSHVKKIDFTAAQGLNSMVVDLRRNNIELFLLINDKQELVLSISRLCHDIKIVSSIQDLKSSLQNSTEMNKLHPGTGVDDKKVIQQVNKTLEKESIVHIMEDTRC